MGWTDSHLHDFEIDGVCYGQPSGEAFFDMEQLDERKEHLGNCVVQGDTFLYRYDFGDDWEHRVKVEKTERLATEPSSDAWLLAGKHACPPEDVGGPGGYQDFLETISDPESPEAQEMLEWVGEKFDSEHFDIENTKAAVLQISRRRKRKG